MARPVRRGRVPRPRRLRRCPPPAPRERPGGAGPRPWSVNYLMMRSLGFADCVPIGDTGVTSGLQALFRLRNADADATRRLMSVFSPHRSLATAHLWQINRPPPMKPIHPFTATPPSRRRRGPSPSRSTPPDRSSRPPSAGGPPLRGQLGRGAARRRPWPRATARRRIDAVVAQERGRSSWPRLFPRGDTVQAGRPALGRGWYRRPSSYSGRWPGAPGALHAQSAGPTPPMQLLCLIVPCHRVIG